MGFSRRTLIGTAAGASAAATLGAIGLSPRSAEAAPAPVGAQPAASGVGDVVGKISVWYQGWFAATRDGSLMNSWWHWGADKSLQPSPSNAGTVSWPDVREYTKTYQSGYANLGNGQPAKLFSSYDQQTVDTHFLWMQQHNIDTAALQRFNPTGSEGPIRDGMTAKVRSAAESHGLTKRPWAAAPCLAVVNWSKSRAVTSSVGCRIALTATRPTPTT